MSNRHGSAVVTLPSDTEILITRQFDAPAALVWEALTRVEHVKRWWGPEWCPITSAEIDLRVGGGWRYVCRMDDGTELGWHGEYREIDPGRSITSTEVFEGFPDAESLNTMTLTETDGVTTLQTLVRHKSQEFRDGHINS
ncbi:MAG TPA: SRPBCC domain-containing protein, partial [Ilumatobacter sp.]